MLRLSGASLRGHYNNSTSFRDPDGNVAKTCQLLFPNTSLTEKLLTFAFIHETVLAANVRNKFPPQRPSGWMPLAQAVCASNARPRVLQKSLSDAVQNESRV